MPRHTMNISLTPELERQVQELVEKGLYNSQSEVVRSGLRLLFASQKADELKLAALREALNEGMADLEAGRIVALEPEEAVKLCRENTLRRLSERAASADG